MAQKSNQTPKLDIIMNLSQHNSIHQEKFKNLQNHLRICKNNSSLQIQYLKQIYGYKTSLFTRYKKLKFRSISRIQQIKEARLSHLLFFLSPDSQNCDFLEACVSLALWPCIANASIKMVKWDLQWPRKLLILRWMADIDLSFSQCPICTKILSHITLFCRR